MEANESKGSKKCKLSGLLYDVEVIDNPMPANSENCKLIVGQLNGGDFFVSACSPRYELVKNSEIFPKINQIFEYHNIDYTVKYFNTDNVRFYVDYTIEDKRYAYHMKNTSDKIMPMLRVQHSYNCQTKYRIMFGYFRLVCLNGLVIPLQEMREFNLCLTGKHTSSIKHSLLQLNQLMDVFATDAKQITESIVLKYETLGGRMVVNVEDRIKEVLKYANVIAVDNAKFNTIDSIMKKINEEANLSTLGYNGKVNDFLIYNGINQYIYDDKRNISATEKRIETDSKVFEFMLQHA